MRIVGVVIIFALISLIDLPKLIKKKKKAELMVYSGILGLAFILSGLHALQFDLWSPDRIITDIVRMVLPWAGQN